jgi:hypothetical protein
MSERKQGPGPLENTSLLRCRDKHPEDHGVIIVMAMASQAQRHRARQGPRLSLMYVMHRRCLVAVPSRPVPSRRIPPYPRDARARHWETALVAPARSCDWGGMSSALARSCPEPRTASAAGTVLVAQSPRTARA